MHLIKGLKSASSRKADFLQYCPQSSIFVRAASVAKPATTQMLQYPEVPGEEQGLHPTPVTAVSQFILIQITITKCFWNVLYQLQYQSIASCTHCSSTAPAPDLTLDFLLQQTFSVCSAAHLSHNKWYMKNTGEAVDLTPLMDKGLSTAACDIYK